jgi:hypothetical protein
LSYGTIIDLGDKKLRTGDLIGQQKGRRHSTKSKESLYKDHSQNEISVIGENGFRLESATTPKIIAEFQQTNLSSNAPSWKPNRFLRMPRFNVQLSKDQNVPPNLVSLN